MVQRATSVLTGEKEVVARFVRVLPGGRSLVVQEKEGAAGVTMLHQPGVDFAKIHLRVQDWLTEMEQFSHS